MVTLYRIEVHRSSDRIHCDCSKLLGDSLGLGSPCDSKEEVVASIRWMATQWLKFDSILGRTLDAPSADNVELIVDPKDLISATEVFTNVADAINKAKGVKTLKDFFG